MSLIALRIALQGLFKLNPIQIAVQGLIDELVADEQQIIGGRAKGNNAYKAPDMQPYIDMMNEQHQRQLRIQRGNKAATEFIMALLQSEILHA